MAFVDDVREYVEAGRDLIDLPPTLGCAVAEVELVDAGEWFETIRWVFQMKTMRSDEGGPYFIDEYVLVEETRLTATGRIEGVVPGSPEVFAVEPYIVETRSWRPV